MTQFLIQEAAFGALEFQEWKEQSGALTEEREAERLLARHAELVAMRDAR